MLLREPFRLDSLVGWCRRCLTRCGFCRAFRLWGDGATPTEPQHRAQGVRDQGLWSHTLPPAPRAWAQLDSQGPSRAGAESHAACWLLPGNRATQTCVPQAHVASSGGGGEGCSVRTRAYTSACLLKKERSPLFSSLMEEGPARTEVGAQVGQASSVISHIFLGGNGCLGRGRGGW